MFKFDNEVGLWYKDGALYDEDAELERKKEKLRSKLLLEERNTCDALSVAYPSYYETICDLYNNVIDRMGYMSMRELELIELKGGELTFKAWENYHPGDEPFDVADDTVDEVLGYGT